VVIEIVIVAIVLIVAIVIIGLKNGDRYMKLRGNDMTLMVYRDGKWRAIAYATTCEIDISADLLEVGSALTGNWRTYKKRKRGWTGSTGHLLADVKQEVDILELVDSDEPVTVCFGSVERHPGQITDADYVLDEKVQIKGEALVTRATVAARRGDCVTISATLQGNGPLEVLWKPWVLESGTWDMNGVWMNHKIWG
jgi:predicted secreted protein